MSEAMAIESIAEEYAKFLGYFTETRVPFKLKKGNSDIDVLGFNPKTKTSLVIECKAWGSPNQYPSFTNSKKWFKEKLTEIIGKWSYFKKAKTNRWNLINLDEIWFIIPGFCDDKSKIEAEISKELKHDIKIIPIHELLLNIMFKVREDKNIRRKRYANTALEFCRWLLRSYETGHLNLIDIDLKLKGEKQTYETLKRNYFIDCLRAVQKNVEKRDVFINTRINSLIILSKITGGTISEIEKESQKRGFDLNYNRIYVGLRTWQRLGIVAGNKKDGYYIVDSFKEIVREELNKKRQRK